MGKLKSCKKHVKKCPTNPPTPYAMKNVWSSINLTFKYMGTIQETAMDFMHRNEHNFYAIGLKVRLHIFDNEVDVESIWYSDKDDKIYIHVCCFEFEGDLDIDSLSCENKSILQKAMESKI